MSFNHIWFTLSGSDRIFIVTFFSSKMINCYSFFFLVKILWKVTKLIHFTSWEPGLYYCKFCHYHSLGNTLIISFLKMYYLIKIRRKSQLKLTSNCKQAIIKTWQNMLDTDIVFTGVKMLFVVVWYFDAIDNGLARRRDVFVFIFFLNSSFIFCIVTFF